MPNIRFNNVNVSYVNRKIKTEVIKDLNVCFQSNKINVILGDSGCGKTTLLKTLVGILEYEGNIYFDDKDIFDLTLKQRDISYTSQNINLYPNMTIFENISFPLRVRKVGRDEILLKTRKIAEALGISQCLNVKGKFISIGQQQRAMIARELVSSPKVIIMDEPFTNLHNELRIELIRLIKKLQKEYNFTLLYVTHSYYEAINLADYLYIMEDGKIVTHGAAKKLLDSKNEYLEKMIEAENLNVDKI